MENTVTNQLQPLVSVVIPCYNSGAFLPEALDSVLSYSGPVPYELVIVDDGSTDSLTLMILAEAESKGCKVLYQTNKGPAAARNAGIMHATGEYILFLDSDNKIKHEYINKGASILAANSEVGVVYGKPVFFGDSNVARFSTHAFDPYKLLLMNNIDMCSMIRKSMWIGLGGLDEERLLIGHEDWEFWIRAVSAGWKFFFIDEILFDYRIRENSLITEATQSSSFDRLLNYIHKKHYLQYIKSYKVLYDSYAAYQFDKQNPFRSFLKYMYLKYFKS